MGHIIIIIAETTVFNVAGYLIEERPIGLKLLLPHSDNIPNKFRILKEIKAHSDEKTVQLSGWTKNSSYYNAPVGDRTYDLPPP